MKISLKKYLHTDMFGRFLILSLAWVGFLVILSGLSSSANSQEVEPNPPDTVYPSDSVRDPLSSAPYTARLGERVDYHVTFGIVPAGKARMEVVDTSTVDGKLTFHIVSSARSAKAFDYVFKVRDSVETWMDADTVYAHQFRKRLNEGRYHDEKLVKFDLENHVVRWWDKGKLKPTIPVAPRVQDVLTAGFVVRRGEMSVGDTFRVKTHDVDKTYDLLIIVRSQETVETLAGTFDCFKLEPVLLSGGLFQKERSARVYVWVTNDVRRIPVMMKSKVSFGSVTAVMEAYDPGHALGAE